MQKRSKDRHGPRPSGLLGRLAVGVVAMVITASAASGCESGGSDGSSSGGSCADTATDCESTDCCSSSDVCVNFTALNYYHCAARCSSDSDCSSNCCRALQSGTRVCHSSAHPLCN